MGNIRELTISLFRAKTLRYYVNVATNLHLFITHCAPYLQCDLTNLEHEMAVREARHTA